MEIPMSERSTDTKIEALCVTCDGMVLARMEGHLGYDDFFGTRGQIESNVRGCAEFWNCPEEADQLLAGLKIAGVNS